MNECFTGQTNTLICNLIEHLVEFFFFWSYFKVNIDSLFIINLYVFLIKYIDDSMFSRVLLFALNFAAVNCILP